MIPDLAVVAIGTAGRILGVILAFGLAVIAAIIGYFLRRIVSKFDESIRELKESTDDLKNTITDNHKTSDKQFRRLWTETGKHGRILTRHEIEIASLKDKPRMIQ